MTFYEAVILQYIFKDQRVLPEQFICDITHSKVIFQINLYHGAEDEVHAFW